MAPTLLAVHAHPDDEASKGAATVAKYSRAGVRTVLATATGGEAGDILNPAMDPSEVRGDLAAVRAQELQTAAGIIGYDRVILLGYRDSGMPGSADNGHSGAFVNARRSEIVERLVGIIRSERPQVVLGYDDHEWYPHPDHLRVHDVTIEAFDAAADPASFRDAGPVWSAAKLYAPVWTIRRMTALARAMEERDLESPFAKRLNSISSDADRRRRITSVEVGATLAAGREALLAHRTQVDPNGPWFAVPSEVVEAAYPYEDFEVLQSRVGWEEGESDLFAGVHDR